MRRPKADSSYIKMKFKPPISSLNSPSPRAVEDIRLSNIFEFAAEDVEPDCVDIESTKISIKNADPYAEDPYDRFIQIKHQTNSLCVELMRLDVYTEGQLRAPFQKEDQIALFERICTARPIIESGILRSFKATDNYALQISRETVLLASLYKELIFCGKMPSSSEGQILLSRKYFQFLRHIYQNIGRMDALVYFFELEAARDLSRDNYKNPSQSSRVDYQAEVKEIVLKLLEKHFLKRDNKFNTMSSAMKEIEADFVISYDELQSSTKYARKQQFFDIESLLRKFREWVREDANFKKSASEFIKL